MRASVYGAVLAIASVALLAQQSSPAEISDPDAYAVYNALLPDNWLVREAHTKSLLIQDRAETTRLSTCEPKGDGMNGAWHDALAALKAADEHAGVWQPRFEIETPYVIVAKFALWQFFHGPGPAGWEAFHANYPDAVGFIELSPVGFDRDRLHALVYMSHHCGGLCGEGNYHFVERQEGRWHKVVPKNVESCGWIS
jgi:hypothetical protein